MAYEELREEVLAAARRRDPRESLAAEHGQVAPAGYMICVAPVAPFVQWKVMLSGVRTLKE